MGSVRSRPENGNLQLDFRYKGIRCREQTLLPDTPANKRKLEKLLEKIEAEILLGTFDYARYFPNSNRVKRFAEIEGRREAANCKTVLFRDFAKQWYAEMEPQWRNSYKKNLTQTLTKYLLPEFGQFPVDRIKKADILGFRGKLVRRPGQEKGTHLSASRINHIMTPLRMILTEAADRYEFVSPWQNIKPLKMPRTDVEPFDLSEVKLILETVRADFRNYYTVRFFAGLRTAEIDGLPWSNVDFKRRQLLIKQALVDGEIVGVKNDGSYRAVDMSDIVYNALTQQRKATGHFHYVFCNTQGQPLSHNQVTKTVWHPLLRHLGLKKRRPYQTRHTAATLWLASGENPEWIARQMGHSSTEMLFKVYSRYVPNLTRQDGSAFEKLLSESFPLMRVSVTYSRKDKLKEFTRLAMTN